MTDDEKRTQDFLNQQEYMVLAVVLDDGTPWATPVKIKKWQGNKFEWDSKLDAVHSQTIETHPNVAVTMFQPNNSEFGQVGFYAKATAALVETGEHELGRYQLTVNEAWINDETFVKRSVTL